MGLKILLLRVPDGRREEGAQWVPLQLLSLTSWPGEVQTRGQVSHAMRDCTTAGLPGPGEGDRGTAKSRSQGTAGSRLGKQAARLGRNRSRAADSQLLWVLFSAYCQGQQGHWGTPGQGTIRCLSGAWHWACGHYFKMFQLGKKRGRGSCYGIKET